MQVIKKIFAFLLLIYCVWVIIGLITGAFGKPVTVKGIFNKTQTTVEHVITRVKRSLF
jgi:hypothetical protein